MVSSPFLPSVLYRSLFHNNTIDFEELSEERIRRMDDDEEEGEGVERGTYPESLPIQEEEAEAVLAEGTVEQVDGNGEQGSEEQSLGTVATNDNSIQ